MSARLRRLIRRQWPQRIRIRLSLIYASLFLAAGSALLGLTYGLLASSLPQQPTDATQVAEVAKVSPACKAPHPDPGVLEACKRAYTAGAAAAAHSQREQTLHNLLLFSLVGLVVMTAASGAAGWVISGRVLRPVRTITETARRASEQHLGERLALTGPRDELKELADTFDAMLERLDRAFAAQRRFVANASHELRTPLTVMRTAIDVTLAKPARTQRQLEDMAARVRVSIDRAEDMISALLTLAVSDQGAASSEFLDLATAAEDAVDSATAGIERLGLRVLTDLEPAETMGDPHLLERMIGNLVDNAVRHNEPDGWIQLRTGTTDTTVFFQIANSGPLISAEALPSLFEPFRRAAGRTSTGDGAGVGLSIVQSVAAAHGASLSAHPQLAGGLDICITLARQPLAG